MGSALGREASLGKTREVRESVALLENQTSLAWLELSGQCEEADRAGQKGLWILFQEPRTLLGSCS